MQNEKIILGEIKQLKSLLAQLLGTQDLPRKQQFSKDALNKAAKEFEKLSIARGDWVESYGISKYIKSAPYGSGNLLINEFGFTNFFKRGRSSTSTEKI